MLVDSAKIIQSEGAMLTPLVTLIQKFFKFEKENANKVSYRKRIVESWGLNWNFVEWQDNCAEKKETRMKSNEETHMLSQKKLTCYCMYFYRVMQERV